MYLSNIQAPSWAQGLTGTADVSADMSADICKYICT